MLRNALILYWVIFTALFAEPYVLDFGPTFPKPDLPEDNPLTVEGVELGRRLFYDQLLSRRNNLSCNNCHEQHSAFSDNRRFSIGFDGETTRRNSMALFNLAYSDGFFWDGRASTLRAQALKPIEDQKEMGARLPNVIRKLQQRGYPALFAKAFGDTEINSKRISLAIEQFMLSLISIDSKYDHVQSGHATFTPAEQRGHDLFMSDRVRCAACHAPPFFTNNTFSNNGTGPTANDRGLAETSKDDKDLGKFKTPSLRNVEVTHRYMHDTRFKTLKDVLEYYNTQVKDSPYLDPAMKPFVGGLGLTEAECTDIIAFLRTLTDHTFLTNPNYADPRKSR